MARSFTDPAFAEPISGVVKSPALPPSGRWSKPAQPTDPVMPPTNPIAPPAGGKGILPMPPGGIGGDPNGYRWDPNLSTDENMAAQAEWQARNTPPGMRQTITPEAVRDLYQMYLGRDPNEQEIQGHINNPGGLAGLMGIVMNSPEARGRKDVGLPPFTPGMTWDAERGEWYTPGSDFGMGPTYFGPELPAWAKVPVWAKPDYPNAPGWSGLTPPPSPMVGRSGDPGGKWQVPSTPIPAPPFALPHAAQAPQQNAWRNLAGGTRAAAPQAPTQSAPQNESGYGGLGQQPRSLADVFGTKGKW